MILRSCRCACKSFAVLCFIASVLVETSEYTKDKAARVRLGRFDGTRPRGLAGIGFGTKVCSLKVCTFNSPTAPRLFTPEHVGGSGYKLLCLINSLAIAKRFGMNFGGYVTFDGKRGETGHVGHGKDFSAVLNILFGAAYMDVFVPLPPVDSIALPLRKTKVWEFETLNGMLNHRDQFKNFTNVWLKSWPAWAQTNQVKDDPVLFGMLRLALLDRPVPSPISNSSGKTLVAMHLRRGDIERRDPFVKASPDEYYFKIVDSIQRLLPNSDVHMFSAVEDQKYWKPSDFDGFAQRGIHVHLDEVSPADAWASMARAGVYIMSPRAAYVSTFALIPALLSRNCVVDSSPSGVPAMFDQRFWRRGRPMPSATANFQAELGRCIKSRLA